MDSILVTGSTGKLGFEMCEYLRNNKIDYTPVGHEDFNLSYPGLINEYLNSHSFSGIIHCAAWTNVNLAEENKEQCMVVNYESTRIIANYCAKVNIPLMFISTDYVFDGTNGKPWETDDEKHPLNVYGLSKSMAEDCVSSIKKHYIIRTSWVFGKNKRDFVKMIVEQSKSQKNINVSCNQIGSPTYATDLVPLLFDIFKSKRYGTYHAHNEGYCSRSAFANTILKIINSDATIIDTVTDNETEKIKRPLNAKLSTSKLTVEGFDLLPTWEDALARYLKIINLI